MRRPIALLLACAFLSAPMAAWGVEERNTPAARIQDLLQLPLPSASGLPTAVPGVVVGANVGLGQILSDNITVIAAKQATFGQCYGAVVKALKKTGALAPDWVAHSYPAKAYQFLEEAPRDREFTARFVPVVFPVDDSLALPAGSIVVWNRAPQNCPEVWADPDAGHIEIVTKPDQNGYLGASDVLSPYRRTFASIARTARAKNRSGQPCLAVFRPR